MTRLSEFDRPDLLRAIARARWSLVRHTRPFGVLLGGQPYLESYSASGLFRASSRLSQGRWLARVAVTASQRAEGRPIHVIELGTCAGISGMYLLAGMARSGGGHLTTFEGHADLAELASHNLRRFVRSQRLDHVTFEVRVGRFEETVVHFFEMEKPRLDLAFIDGHHLEEPTLAYHRMTMAHIADRGIVVHDDISWSRGMARAWATIKGYREGAVAELMLGGQPARGVLFLGDAPEAEPEQYDLDSWPERQLRRLLSMFRDHET